MKHINVTVVRCDDIFPYEQWQHLFTASRLEKISHLRHESDKKMSAGVESALLASLKLQRYNPIDSIYTYSENGQPILNLTGKHISLSHSGGLAVCALSEIPVGVDIEVPRKMSSRIKNYILSDSEINRDLFDRTDDISLLKKWTAKESYFKLTGTGIDRHSMQLISASDGRIAAGNLRYAYYETVSLSDPECIISCSAYEPISLKLIVLSSSQLIEIL